ncbi:fumarylacetoacetate hydrolase family protein [Oceanibacterium hippocampi]|uniref:fumarylacetoacetate hydrolase family protein n=1 Tax=Oceanibacterium hippocampi TaxID=745714 RepID=UPI001593EC8D|nr:fumarylacetoacetate hydrolase family protein [Oceanibacterium hippocampi]
MLAFADDEASLYPVIEVAELIGQKIDPAIVDPFGSFWLQPEGLAELAALDARRAALDLRPVDRPAWHWMAPVPRPGKIIAVGRNYMDHVREGQEIWKKRGKVVEIPKFPSAFAKFPSSLSGPRDEIRIPAGLDDIDYEIELAVVIGTAALNVSADEALRHVAGYAVCNDVATRGIQRREMETQVGITLAKNYPSFAPMGPWLTTSDVVGDPQSLRLVLDVDGDVRQDASTSDMIFPVAELISYWSSMGLEPGDILITGTPSGVALAREEPEKYYLRPGQTVTARIEGLGELRNPVR